MSAILIIGLGNPGDKYEKTRHNAGALTVDALAKKLEVKLSKDTALHAFLGETHHEGKKVILAKPTTFMNVSGDAVGKLRERFHVTPENVWIIVDDTNLPLGTLRVRKEGSAGGHNGLKSVIEALKTESFPRFKIGVDAPPANVPLEAWVVSKFSTDEMVPLKEVIEQTVEAVTDALKEGIDAYTTAINS